MCGVPIFFYILPLLGLPNIRPISALWMGVAGLSKWDPRDSIGVYIGHFPFYAGSVALLLNSITGHVSPQYHVVYDEKFSTVEHMRKGTVPINWKNLVEEHSDIATQEKYTLAK